MNINIASTYTSDVLRIALQSYLQKFCTIDIRFFYNQFFQQTLFLNSDFNTNEQGLNVILFRLSDYISYQEKDYEINKKQDDLVHALSLFNRNMKVPLLFILTPSLGKSEKESRFFINFERLILQSVRILKNTILFGSDTPLNKYHSDIFNEFTEKHGHIPYTTEFYHSLATLIARTYSLLSRKPFKVIVLDCDGTLWNGIIEEQGINGIEIDPHYQELQQFFINCFEQGFLLCLCSKNNENSVVDVFKNHPDMLMNIDKHICTSRINWDFKSNNIKEIAEELNLGLDSFVFIDDSKVECAEVKSAIPEILAIELPKDKTKRLTYLKNIWAFDVLNKENEDISRTQFYQTNKLRNHLKSRSVSYTEFLKNLQIKTHIVEATEKDYERIYELNLRTNQFNLYPRVMTGIELHYGIKHGRPKVLKIEVNDKFMNYGLVGVLIYDISRESLTVKSFFLSCRILGRGIEYDIVNYLVGVGEKYHADKIIFDFTITDKNTPAVNFLKKISNQRTFIGNSISLLLNELKGFTPIIEEEKPKPQTELTPNKQQRAHHDYMLSIAFTEVAHQNKAPGNRETKKNKDYDSIKTHLHELFLSHHIKIDQNDVPFIYYGLNSLQSVLISGEIYKSYHVEINPVNLLHCEFTIDRLFLKLLDKLKYIHKVQVPLPQLAINETPLSRAQKRLWYDEQLTENKSSKNTMFIAFQLEGAINKDAFNQSFASLIKKHEALRFCFIDKGNEPYIKILSLEELNFNIDFINYDDTQKLDTLVTDFKTHYFDLNKAPLFRVAIINPDSNSPLFLMSIHHIIHDGWSLNLLLKELTVNYGLYSTNDRIIHVLEHNNNYSYVRYIYSEKTHLSDEYLNKNKHFWSKYLHKLPKLELIYARPEKEIEHISKCARMPFKLDKLTSSRLKKLAFTHHLTIYEVLVSAFGLFLSQLTNQEDIHFTTAVSGRHHSQISNTIGFFVNLLILRFQINRNKPFIELAKEQKKIISSVLAHQDLSYHEILHEAGESVGSKNTSFHQAGFVFQNYPTYHLEINGSICKRIYSDDDVALLYDACKECRFGNLVCFMQEFDDQLHGLFEYNSHLYSNNMIYHYIESFQTLLKHCAIQPLCISADIPLLSEQHKNLLLHQWNQEITPYEPHINLLTQFSKIVTNFPYKVAVRSNNINISYLELDNKSSLLAKKLHEEGIEHETPVAIYLEKGIQQITAVLAVLKAGGCYVPLDTDLPYQRMNYILKDSEVPLILVDEQTREHLSSFALNHIKIIDTSLPMNSETLSYTMPLIEIKPNNLAYILYTSGSTGTPKGVMIEHNGIMRLVQSTNYINIVSDDRIAQASNFLFDASTLEIWGALLNGATLVCLPQKILLDKKLLRSFLKEEQISILFLTTQLFHTYAHVAPELFPQLKYLVIGGEVLLADSVAHVFEQEKHPRYLINGYGPTENTTFSTTYLIKNSKQIINPIPIGKPITGTKAYVLSRELNLLPVGAIGTLYLSGLGLARRYLNQEQLNRDKFIHLFGERLYNTGDLVAWQSDGNLKYIGREDNQIKLNGYRIELNEIETQLKTHPLIEQAIVLAIHREHHRYIAAYILLKENESIKKINLYHHIKQTLPQYMMPHFFYQIDHVPMTSNGKVDKKQLEQSNLNAVNYIEFEPAKTPLEIKLALIYANILHLEQEKISINTDFFDMGGNSISALQLIHSINIELKLNITFSILYETANIKLLSQYIETVITNSYTKQNTHQTLTQKSPLKLIKKGSDKKTPLIFIHPIGGTGFCYIDLIKLLPDSQPCYLIQDPSIDSNTILFDDMSAMAAHYNQLILTYFGHSSFLLAGYSFGGMLSIEMASQLGNLEHLVAGIIAFDTWVVSNLLDHKAKNALKLSIMNQYKQVEENLLKEHINPQPWMKLYFTRLQELGFNYIPPKVKSKIILFKANHLAGEFAAMRDNSNFLQLHSTKIIEIHPIPGNHNTILQVPFVNNIASILAHHPILDAGYECD